MIPGDVNMVKYLIGIFPISINKKIVNKITKCSSLPKVLTEYEIKLLLFMCKLFGVVLDGDLKLTDYVGIYAFLKHLVFDKSINIQKWIYLNQVSSFR